MARPTSESTALSLKLQADLARFARLCTYIKDKNLTNRTEIARRLGLEPKQLTACLLRLERRYGKLAEEVKKNLVLTYTGELIADYYHNHVSTAFDDLELHFKRLHRDSTHISIGASPFLLAHLMPYVINDFLDLPSGKAVGRASTRRKDGVHISCQEAYHIDDTIRSLLTDEFDCAIIWNYEGREATILRTAGLTCLRASRSLPAVVLFGRDHEYTNRLETPNALGRDAVKISELDKEQLFILEEGHQPFADRIPDVAPGGSRIEQTSILSMISAIRAGVSGVAIVAGVFPALDRYRRDGSLFLLPLVRDDGVPLLIDVLYVFKGINIDSQSEPPSPSFAIDRFSTASQLPVKVESAEQPAKKDEAKQEDDQIARLTIVRSFLSHLEVLMKDQLVRGSGWNHSLLGESTNYGTGDALLNVYREITKFTHSYHVSADQVGFDVPMWIHSTITWKTTGKKTFGQNSIFEGRTETQKDNGDIYVHAIDTKMVGKQVICVQGHLVIQGRGDRDNMAATDSFVANLYLVLTKSAPRMILGVWSGRDDSAQTALTAPFVLSEEPLGPHKLRNAAYVIMLRTLIDVRALPPGDGPETEEIEDDVD